MSVTAENVQQKLLSARRMHDMRLSNFQMKMQAHKQLCIENVFNFYTTLTQR